MRSLILLMYGAALRTSEALSLTIANVDLSGAVLTVRDSKFFKTRLVPIGPKTVRVLAEYAGCRHSSSRNPDAPSFFDGTRSGSLSTSLRGLSNKSDCMRVSNGKAVPAVSLSGGVRQAVLPPLIHGKSRLRRRARTDVRGAISDGRPYRDTNPVAEAYFQVVRHLGVKFQ
jgi:hypothetical protein